MDKNAGKKKQRVSTDLCAIAGVCFIIRLYNTSESEKVQDLEFTVVRPEEIPETLKSRIESKLEEKFTLTYRDSEYLYIARGYGQQETGGYCITVDQCYLSENAVCIKTTLTGPQPGEEVSTAPSCPYIVLKLEQRDEEVVFE